MSQETVLSNYQGKYQDKYLASTEFGKEASMIIIHHFLQLLSSFWIQASGTIGDYLTGTITLVFGIFFLFLLLSLLTIILTTYARYKVCALCNVNFNLICNSYYFPITIAIARAAKRTLQALPTLHQGLTGHNFRLKKLTHDSWIHVDDVQEFKITMIVSN